MADESVTQIITATGPADFAGNVAELAARAYEPRCLRPGCDLGEHGTPWIGTRTLDQGAAQAELEAHWQRHRDAERRLELVDQLAGDMESAWNNWGQWPARADAPKLFLALAERIIDSGRWIQAPEITQEMVDAAMGRAPVPLSDLDTPGAAVRPGVPHVPQPGETDWRLL